MTDVEFWPEFLTRFCQIVLTGHSELRSSVHSESEFQVHPHLCVEDLTLLSVMSSTLDTKQTHTQLTLLPAELWQDIVGLENLRVRDVASYRLVCKLFGSLGQGCMFRNLIFRFNLGIFIREGTAGIAKNIFQKLEFYSSESIAHHVRYCEFEGFSFTSPPHEMDSVIIHRFFETLPRFQNVSHLAIHYAELNRFELEQLARLPTLERLDITDCIIREPTLPELGLNLRHLQLCADTLYNTNDSILRWLLLGQHFTRITQLRIVLRTMKGIDLVETVSPLVRRLDTVRVTVSVDIIGAY